ncbi:glycosyltransferase [Natrialbaceae archaeon A-CW1-1]
MPIGGAERIALNLSTGLDDKGYDVDLVLVDASGRLLNALPEAVTIIDLNATRVATSILPLKRYLERHEPDVLYSMMTEVNVIAVLASQLAKADTKLVISEHNTPTVSADGLKDQFVLKLVAHTYPRADHVVTVSRGVRDDLLDVVNLPAEDVSVIYNPIDIDRIRARADEPLDHEWLDDPNLNVILSAGRHAPQKGFDTLLRAFARLDDPTTRLILLGDGEERESLMQLATELGIEDRTDFPGFVDNPFSYMARANLFALSSWYEGFGNVLIEAMATGCPIVSTDCPSGPSEILEDGRYGALVPVKNGSAMAASIVDVLENPTNPEDIRKRANEFATEAVVDQYVRLFDSVGS